MFRSATSPTRTDWHNRKGQQQRGKGNHRCQGKDDAIREFRDPVFFKEHFDHVRNQLERTAPANTVRSVTVLEQTQQATFAKAHECPAGDNHQQDHHRFEDSSRISISSGDIQLIVVPP